MSLNAKWLDRAADDAARVWRDSPNVVIGVVGPTASGKTELAMAISERISGEIVSVDSVQVYREFDRGTGKPTPEERARVAHHVIDVRDPHDAIDAAQFVALADRAMADIRSRGRVPVVCGGTFLWMRALLLGLAPIPPGDEAIRRELRAIADDQGAEALHVMLRQVDPQSAERLHRNDFVRVTRALEVFRITGKPLSAWHNEHAFRGSRHPHRLIGIDQPREVLDERIRVRIRGWMEAGWVTDVQGLIDRGYRSARAMGSVGFAEIALAVEAAQRSFTVLDTEALTLQIIRKTRVFVRRQRTWLRDETITWYPTG
jgi:tRNA dimethylallyltransferase